jgi:hypothetical protein
MLPKTHLISSTLVVFALALYLRLDAASLVLWSIAAAASTLALDLDHVLICMMTERGRNTLSNAFREPVGVLSDVESFHDKIHFKGAGIFRLITHAILFAFAGVFFVKHPTSYSTPVVVSLAVHITSDAFESLINPNHR